MKLAEETMNAAAVVENSELSGIEVAFPKPFPRRDVTAVAKQERIGSRPVQFNLSEEAYEKLSQLKESLGAASKTEVVRLGLGVLGWIVEELSEDHKILVKRAPGVVVELAFPYLAIKKKLAAAR
jgi:hypothetical protein